MPMTEETQCSIAKSPPTSSMTSGGKRRECGFNGEIHPRLASDNDALSAGSMYIQGTLLKRELAGDHDDVDLDELVRWRRDAVALLVLSVAETIADPPLPIVEFNEHSKLVYSPSRLRFRKGDFWIKNLWREVWATRIVADIFTHDILCLREAQGNSARRAEEWKLDMPTIGWVKTTIGRSSKKMNPPMQRQ
ncbi:uncharacterized protein BT62DRAFT_923274 [Guyanagaster necrorhizus]|uniref:Uncharacterized protein n=1 Tax=Guyanagaster necrorhizus TaxID=856835 RepID=A0A9P7VI57_9AGAR|nr:uncharacterized protein BT62DRAFT_923274 [Guyanagaster necrorhizus MCA 3950]KAG7441493.1 hypothetical protein BT62DRAFT_923274 [Guyanagaster necrorhizus MCA 3950]